MEELSIKNLKNSSHAPLRSLGTWTPGLLPAQACDSGFASALQNLAIPFYLIGHSSSDAIGVGGSAYFSSELSLGAEGYPIRAYVPGLNAEQLGDPNFCYAHQIRYAYVAGEMANGIASEEMVEAMGRAGMLGFFGAAGLSLERVESAILRIRENLKSQAFGFNLIHSPSEPELETRLVALYLKHQLRLVCASAYLDLTLPVVRYRCAGIYRNEQGKIVTPNRLIAKVSRVEVAKKFLSPPPLSWVQMLVKEGTLTPEQAEMTAHIPMAEDITAEADSGGHTDNRPAITLLPTMIALRDRIQSQHNYSVRPRVGAAGGIATPSSAIAAFAMGAAYVVTGSINQSCIDAGLSPAVKTLLAQAGQADVVMAPAADMFEMGVKVQVLKQGTMFAIRARKLYDLYRDYPSLESIPQNLRLGIERDALKNTFEESWKLTRDFFISRAPAQVAKAEADPKHKMALVFRSYLGQSSKWAISGEESRRMDYQVWCGPAMGAFNEWVKGTYLEAPQSRSVVLVAQNIMFGAAVLSRLAILKTQAPDFPVEKYFSAYGPVAQKHLAYYFDVEGSPEGATSRPSVAVSL